MKTLLEVARNRATRAATWMTILGVCVGGALAQTPTARITSAISGSSRVTLVGSHPPLARTTNETGRLASTTTLEGVTIGFARSAAQEADLLQLLTAQQTKGSAEYRKWLTPDEFATRFGMADSDLAKVEAWIKAQGMTVTRVARSKNAISFTGTAAQMETAFGTELHTYKVNGESHFAPSTDLQIPEGMAGTVTAVTNLSNFRPHTHVKPKYTSSQSGDVFMTPLDVRTIYDVTPIYNAGYTGKGETIVVLGQSAVVTSDISNFQTALGLTANVPTLTLVPSTGTSAVSSGDEVESDLDLEYVSALAYSATINFVYTGNSNNNNGIFDSLVYAVDQKLGTVISNSYGECEYVLGNTDYTLYNNYLEQATTQGQTVISASGDDGSTDCFENYGSSDPSLTLTEAEALGVDFPASSQYVTGIGGSEFPSADAAVGTYWSAAASSTTDALSSAFQYIPEQVWNDDSAADGLGSGGGGVSLYTTAPSWQTGVTGIPSGQTFRLVPDISFDASPNNAGYLYCSSDTSTNITGSCADGLRASNDEALTVAGGTSFGAPIFAGITALIDQSQGGTGLGSTMNPKLYGLAATRYASVFHDITTGNNECSAGSAYCDTVGESDFPATAGYDEASGLGSINAYNLLTEWSATLAGSATMLTPATPIPAVSATDQIAITVATGSSTATAVPTGSVTISVDGVAQTPVALTSGAATFAFTSTTAGAHLIAAVYSGDTVYAGSGWTTMVYVGGSTTTTTSSGSFALKATSVTVSSGSSGTSTVTVTPAGGYTGTVDWTLSSTGNLNDTCYDISNLAVTGTAAVTTTLTLYTNSSDCSSSAVQTSTGHVRRKIVQAATAKTAKTESAPVGRVPVTIALGSVLMLGFVGRKRRAVRLLVMVLALGIAAVGMTGCGSSSSTSTTTTTSSNQATGTYTITIVGTDSLTSSITASTTLTLTVD